MKSLNVGMKCIMLIFIMTNTSYASDYAQFHKMWPNSPQPWYFKSLGAVTYDQGNNTFLAMDKYSGLISRLTPNGYVLNRWGGVGKGQGQFMVNTSGLSYKGMLNNMDIDSIGNVYVTDPFNCRIQKFSSSGDSLRSINFSDLGIFSDLNICTLANISSNARFIPISVSVSKNGILAVLFTNRLEFYSNDKKVFELNLQEEFTDISFSKKSDDFYLISPKITRRYDFSEKSYVEWNTPYYNKDDEFAAITNIETNKDDNLLFSVPSSGTFHIYNSNGQSLYEKKYFKSNSEILQENNLSNSIADYRQIAAIPLDGKKVFLFDQSSEFIKSINLENSNSIDWGVSRHDTYSKLGYPKSWFKSKLINKNIMISDKFISIFNSIFELESSYAPSFNASLFSILASSFTDENKIFLIVKDNVSGKNYIAYFTLIDMKFKLVSLLDDALQNRIDIAISVDKFNHIFLSTKETTIKTTMNGGYNRLYHFDANTKKFVYIDLDDSIFDVNLPMFNEPISIISGHDNIVSISESPESSMIYIRNSLSHGVASYLWSNDYFTKIPFLETELFFTAEKLFSFENGLMIIDNNFDLLEYKNGEMTQKINLGSRGVGYMNYSDISDINILNNEIYITEAINKRLQILQIKNIPDRSKAIIVTGGDQSGNPLWDETQSSANHAFWTLQNQGYTKDNIQYLNRNADLDLDGNGKPDDVDGLPTRVNVKASLTEWARDAEDVVLYMVGHGGNGTFQLGGGEILTATELRAWLDELQAVMPGKVTVIYDACESGSFQKPLSGSPYPRTVITSTSAKALESAYFQDAISFSHLFWNEVFSGKTVSEAFQTTQTSINQAFGSQSPQIDSDGDGITNTANDYNVVAQQAIGNGTVYTGTAPTVGSVGMTPVGKGESTSTLTAYNISDDKGVQSVWAIVRPPYANLGQDGKPVQNLPRVDLAKQADGSYQNQFDGFEQPGTYQVIVYAQDQEGNISQPVVETLNVISALERKAVIVGGMDEGVQFSQEIKTQTDHAYNTLVSQGYSESSIEYLSASNVATAGVDRAASKEGLEFALTEWAASSASDLLVYLVGDFTDGQYRIAADTRISLTELNQWLDAAQSKMDGVVTVIHEGAGSGRLVTGLKSLGNKQRIVISSSGANQASHVFGNGEASFSRFFWNGIAQGSVVADAFSRAQAAMRQYQYAQINSNGNTQANEKNDLYQAKWHKLGLGLLLAADEPKIGAISPNASTSNQTSTLWVDSITSLSPLKKVWAVVTPPGYNPAFNSASQRIELDLHDQGNGRWQATYGGFERAGEYQVSIYALDNSNRLSAPRTTYVTQTQGPDGYEADDHWTQAKGIAVNTGEAQWRNFHQANDVDYIRFDANPADGQYTLEVKGEGTVDTVVSLYDSRGQAVTGVDSQGRLKIDDTGRGDTEWIYWKPAQAGTYYLEVSPADNDNASIAVPHGYQVRIFPTVAPQKARIRGRITNANGQPIVGAMVWVGQNDRTTTDANGNYILPLNSGNYDLYVEATAYEPMVVSLKVQPEDILTQDMELTPALDKPTVIEESNTSLIQTSKLPTTTITAGHGGQVVMHILRVTAPAGGAELRQLKLKGSGTGNEVSDIKAVRLYHDTNRDHQVDGGDVQLGQVQTFNADDGRVIFALPKPYLLEQGAQNILVTYEF